MTSRLRPPIDSRDHVLGRDDAPATLVEFGDYECPFCGEAQPSVKALQRRLRDRLRFAFRHFPLTSAHPHAAQAAEAAEAAGAQGRFWEMHDLLYANQDALDVPDLIAYATRIGLDLDRFVGDLQTERMRNKVRADVRSGALSGVNGTPTFFVNGWRHDGSWDLPSLWSAIERALGAELRP